MATTQPDNQSSENNSEMEQHQEQLSARGIKDRLKASYDIIAPAYNSWTIPNSAQRLQYLDKLIALIPQLSVASDAESNNTNASTTIKILELGCGCGIPVTQKLLSFPNVQVLANDISSTQIKLAKEALLGSTDDNNQDNQHKTAGTGYNIKDRIQFLEGDMLSVLDPTPSSLDAVLGLYSIFHLPRQEQSTMLSKIHTWLKPGGLLLANFAEDEAEAVIFDKWLHDDGWMFYSGWGAEKTLNMVRECGFEVVVGQVEEDSVRARFLWVIGRKM